MVNTMKEITTCYNATVATAFKSLCLQQTVRTRASATHLPLAVQHDSHAHMHANQGTRVSRAWLTIGALECLTLAAPTTQWHKN